MSHPSLGQAPLHQRSEASAARIRDHAPRLAQRALVVALDADPALRERYDEAGLRHLLRDAELIADRVALAVATEHPAVAREYAEQSAPVYRRLKIPMDDLVALCEGLRVALPGVLPPADLPAADRAIDAAAAAFRWHRRLAGDARKKNAFLQFLYKGG